MAYQHHTRQQKGIKIWKIVSTYRNNGEDCSYSSRFDNRLINMPLNAKKKAVTSHNKVEALRQATDISDLAIARSMDAENALSKQKSEMQGKKKACPRQRKPKPSLDRVGVMNPGPQTRAFSHSQVNPEHHKCNQSAEILIGLLNADRRDLDPQDFRSRVRSAGECRTVWIASLFPIGFDQNQGGILAGARV
ncbi:unnamed protein product [Lupinus luteus]|uniref:Uncharacterized protein n=1 Tax=Lupinus luteus TaxID=3873 RepID=A0AAV1W1E6_LUPLU